MSDLWIYRRRSSSLTRYRHGGAAAFDPVMRPLLAGEHVITSTGALLQPAVRDENKILQFPGPKSTARKKRGDKPRTAGRAKPDKPAKPKRGKKRE